jgi:hypothetical protein
MAGGSASSGTRCLTVLESHNEHTIGWKRCLLTSTQVLALRWVGWQMTIPAQAHPKKTGFSCMCNADVNSGPHDNCFQDMV